MTQLTTNDDVLKIIEGIQQAKEMQKIAAKREEKLKQDLYNYMGENDALINHQTGEEDFVTWKYNEGATRFNTKQFAQERPEIYEKYLSKSEPVRTLRIKK